MAEASLALADRRQRPVAEHVDGMDGTLDCTPYRHTVGWDFGPVLDAVGSSPHGHTRWFAWRVPLAAYRAVGGGPDGLTRAASRIRYGHR